MYKCYFKHGNSILQVGVGGAVKRPSPEPVGNEIGHQLPKQLAKKPKVQKKKKKRDPNEPQKYVQQILSIKCVQ